jgi:hypothetical protein
MTTSTYDVFRFPGFAGDTINAGNYGTEGRLKIQAGESP